MIIVPVKDGDNIERALKRFKRKFEKTGAIRELRARKNFEKPSVKKRMAREKAIYVQHLRDMEENYLSFNHIKTGSSEPVFCFPLCGWRGSNPHALRHRILSPACLPIPTHPRGSS